MAERGLALHSGGAEGGGRHPGAGTTEEGRTVETRGRDPRRGASAEAGGAGADLTACEEARRGPAWLMEGLRNSQLAARSGVNAFPSALNVARRESNSLAVAMATELGRGTSTSPGRHWKIPWVLWDSVSLAIPSVIGL